MQSPMVPSNSTRPLPAAPSRGAGRFREVRHQLDDAIGQRQNPAVVGRDDHHPVSRGELADQPQHLLDLDEVEVRGRLVGEDQRRIERDRPRDRDTLLLTAAEITWPVGRPVLQSDPRQQLFGLFVRRATAARRAQRHHHVLQRGEAGHQVERLEHDAHRLAPVFRQPLASSDVTSTSPNLMAPPVGWRMSAETRQQRGLPTAAGAQQDHQ